MKFIMCRYLVGSTPNPISNFSSSKVSNDSFRENSITSWMRCYFL